VLRGEDGAPILSSAPGAGFGVCGEVSLWQFEVPPTARFFGMGEKTFGRLELSGLRTKFWNTDVWGDFHWAQWTEHPADPPYLSIPYLIIRVPNGFVGLLLASPWPAFMETPGIDEAPVFVEWQRTAPTLLIGNEGGEPDLWLLHDPTLNGLTRKLQRLVGTTPLPPLWALGYHQSRWGYAGHKDLQGLDREFTRHEIPCDGLWLDIDYMRGYRVFTVDPAHFPKGVKATAEALAKKGRRIVAILDPGVKREKGYDVYDDGVAKDLFCHGPEGSPYVGMVWPGETVFPDFSLPEARAWWSSRVEAFAREGFGGAWLDMNDPSTGPVDPHGMRFQRGRLPHAAFRNLYALGMQKASYEGFLAARPHERPFLLTRSGFAGTSRYSAAWTGDNLSNDFYLGVCIPTSLNLALSGLPFNGPDIGGFGDDASPRLMLDWVKACFLFPFFRNHSVKDSKPQEPWRYPGGVGRAIARYIRLRYRFLPYLYNLFAEQELSGEPILRPLVAEFDSRPGVDLAEVADQFLVGPYILQAPLLKRARNRCVVLPGRTSWLEANTGAWVKPGTHVANRALASTPLYLREGAIVPMAGSEAADLKDVCFLVAARADGRGESETRYHADDGISFGYRDGQRSTVSVRAKWRAGVLDLTVETLASGYGAIRWRFAVLGSFETIRVNGVRATPCPERLELTGRPLSVQIVGGP
ncbi:MAG: hypothetical protein H6534_09310, partial [Chthonomonadaceae bacterium]|nr:hypothetical protein [Chthonomonadaceae bacterium]